MTLYKHPLAYHEYQCEKKHEQYQFYHVLHNVLRHGLDWTIREDVENTQRRMHAALSTIKRTVGSSALEDKIGNLYEFKREKKES